MVMVSKNIPKYLSNVLALETAVIKTTTNGASVDLQNKEGVAFYAVVGATGDTLGGSAYFELELQESADNSTWTAVADADIENPVSGTNNTGTYAKIDANTKDQTVYVGEYRGSKRYVRTVVRATGSHANGTPIGVVALMGNRVV